MSDLYGLAATHRTRPVCALADVQNARLADVDDASSARWGVSVITHGSVVQCRRQAHPNQRRDVTRTKALDTGGRLVLAALQMPRGEHRPVPSPDAVTQPSQEGTSMLVMDGTIPHFESVRPDLESVLQPKSRAAMRGQTPAEHVFQLLQERYRQVPGRSMADTVRVVVKNLQRWTAAVDPDASFQLAFLWSRGTTLAGVRLNAPLWTVERTAPPLCDACTCSHAFVRGNAPYHAVVVASMPFTDEDWTEVPNASVFETNGSDALTTSPLDERPTSLSWLNPTRNRKG